RKDERIVTDQSDDRRIIDASTPNNKDKVHKPSDAKSPNRQSSHSPEQFHNQTATKNKDNDSTSRQGDTITAVFFYNFSLTPTNNNRETKIESNNSQRHDQSQQPTAPPKNTNKSKVNGVWGRGKPKQN
ncbi:unnamed protein product, partial [Adineta steineri]